MTDLARLSKVLEGTTVTRKAAKLHVCSNCQGEIQIGETYIRRVSFFGNLRKTHAWDCSLIRKVKLRGWKDTHIIHQRFSYLVFAGVTFGVCLHDPKLMPPWYQRVVELLGPVRKFSAGPAWFVVHNKKLSGPFADLRDAEAFLRFI